jgi:predicted glycoside hydrolase/deacetylase ChbG (UPF0249 family)
MTKKNSRIPTFKSIQEEAEFWDTHSFTDFWDELKPVQVKVSRNLSHITHVRLDDQTLAGLEAEASKKGVATGTLIRMWIKERLAEVTPQRRVVKIS